MYQELEMWKSQQKKKQMKIKFNHEHVASVSAVAFFAIIAILIFTVVN